MRVLYPLNPLNEKEADEPYQAEFLALKSLGVSCSLFDFDTLSIDSFSPQPSIQSGEKVLYRGWMLSEEMYQVLVDAIALNGGYAITSTNNYLHCHHLPNWLETCAHLTPETVILKSDENLTECISQVGWKGYFVKDFVKSNSTEKGSIANSPSEVIEILNLIKLYRGSIEGGVVLRKVEDFIEETEQRCFVINGKVFTHNNVSIPIVNEIADLIDAPFYSVDIIKNSHGLYRLVELGDGQVSDKKNWDLNVFVSALQSLEN